MARMLSIFAVFAAALALASGTRLPLQAATTPSADLVFLIEASQASFTNATTLALNGLTATAQSYGAGAKTGIYPIQNFTDASANSQYVDSSGQWLSNPQAVMYGVTQDGNVTTVLLTLSNPTPAPQQAASTTTNNNNNNNAGSTITNNNNGPPELTFTVALVPTDASKVKYQNGVVAAKVAEAANGVGNLAQAITAGATFGPVVIYIDQNQQGLSKKATTKWGGGGWGGGGWGGGWNNGWGNNGYNNGYGYGGSSNNNNNNNNNGGWGGNNNNNNNNNNGGYGGNNNNNNNNNNGGGWGSSNNNNNNNNNGGYGSSNNNNNNNNGRK